MKVEFRFRQYRDREITRWECEPGELLCVDVLRSRDLLSWIEASAEGGKDIYFELNAKHFVIPRVDPPRPLNDESGEEVLNWLIESVAPSQRSARHSETLEILKKTRLFGHLGNRWSQLPERVKLGIVLSATLRAETVASVFPSNLAYQDTDWNVLADLLKSIAGLTKGVIVALSDQASYFRKSDRVERFKGFDRAQKSNFNLRGEELEDPADSSDDAA